MFNVETVRESFPALHVLKDGKPIIYADSACMALKPQVVIDSLTEYYREYSACAGRSPHFFARQTTAKFEDARDIVARFINARDSGEIVWVKNTTEALNLGSGILQFDGSGETIIVTSDSHNSNLVKWMYYADLGRIDLEVLNVGTSGRFNEEQLVEKLEKSKKGRILVTLAQVSNVTGAILNIKNIAKIVHEYGGIIQVDGAQSFPHQTIDVQNLDIDLMGVSMHKACGPTGTGFLFGKQEILESLNALILGGETVRDVRLPDRIDLLPPPARFEAGLQNYAGIIGSGAAIEFLNSLGMTEIHRHNLELSTILMKGLQDLFGEKIAVLGPPNPIERVALAAIDLKEINAHEVAILMDEMFNIFLRSGFHCTHGLHHQLGLNQGTLRPSWYLYNTKNEVNLFLEALAEILETLGL
ncbi:MAG: aminotransferase class V-fold PLP-dependent enzyme [Candidatus Thorarchaeota archaeon]